MSQKIKIPKGLPIAVCGNRRLQKAVAFWLVLKSQCDSGIVYTDCREWATQMQLTPRTIKSRFNDLVKFGLAKNSGKCVVVLISYAKIKEKFNVTDNQNYYVKKEESPILHCRIAALAISDKKKMCKHAFDARAAQIELKAYLCNVLRVRSIDLNEALKRCQLSIYALGSEGYTHDEVELINHLNPDFNIGYKTLSSIYGYNGIGSMAYLKRKLQHLKLISVEKRDYIIPNENHRTQESRTTILGSVFFSRKSKKLVLNLCDKIHVL